MQDQTRARGWVAGLLLVGALASAMLGRAVAYDPSGFPTWDSAGYLLQASKLRSDLLGLDLVGFGKELTRPDLHPPGHGLALALWLAVFGDTLAAARAYATFAFGVGLASITWLGSRMDRAHGLVLGALAALLTALGLGHVELVATPMTEATALPAVYAALAVCARDALRPGAGPALRVGLALLGLTMVRYNLGPMVGVGLVAFHAWEALRGRRAWRELPVAAWFGPTAAVFAAWQLLRPDLLKSLLIFFENRSSGIPFWSVENLLWVPIQTGAAYLGTALLAWPLVFAWLGGGLRDLLRAPAPTAPPAGQGSPADPSAEDAAARRLVWWVTAVAMLLLTLHDFKITRNLGPFLPALYLGALGTLGGLLPAALRRSRPLVGFGLVGLGAYGAWQHHTTFPALARAADFRPDPTVGEALDFVEAQARTRERVWIVGYNFRLSPNLLEWWLRSRRVPTKLLMDAPIYGEKSRTGVQADWDDRYATYVADTMLAPATRDQTTFLTIETTPGTRFHDDWKAYGNNYSRAFAEQAVAVEVARYEAVDAGVTIHAWRTGEAPMARVEATPEPGPPGALWHDGLDGSAASWRIFPPDALSRVKLGRGDGALTVTVATAEPSLQLCDEARVLPEGVTPGQPLRARFRVGLDGGAGRAWLHLRGMDDAAALQKRADGSPDIAQGGPVVDGDNELAAAPQPSATKLRACLVLDGFVGVARLEDYALLPAGAAASGGPAAAPAAAPVGWRWVGEPPAGAHLDAEGAALRIRVPEAQPRLQICGAPTPYEGPADVSARVEGSWTGRAWLHWRALDAGGVLLVDTAGAGQIAQAGPLTGPTPAKVHLSFPVGARSVRPCLVLDGVAGELLLTPGG